MNGKTKIDSMTADEKMRKANYLLFTNEDVNMSLNLLEHRCGFWNFTRDGVASGSGWSFKRSYSTWTILNIILILSFFYF